jgi:phosphohistidine phosphatase
MRLRPAWFYRQSAVIPYRQSDRSLEVLLITSRRGRHWVFPKGVVERGESAATSAAREAFEEAGVRGVVNQDLLGTYTYEKWGGICTVEVFSLLVTDVLEDWPEADRRRRTWLPIDDAARAVKPETLRTIVTSFAAHLHL